MLPQERITQPGENFVNESQVITKIVKDLAPELLSIAEVMKLIKAFVFPVSPETQPTYSKLRSTLKKHVSNNVHLELLLTVLKGAIHFKKCYQLDSFPAFDQQLQLNKEEAMEELYDENIKVSTIKRKLSPSKKVNL